MIETTTTSPQRQTVRKVTAKDIPAMAQTMARAFYADPVVGDWCTPHAATRMRRLSRGFELFLRKVHFPHDHCYATDDLKGGALWLPPGEAKLEGLAELRLLAGMARAYGRELPRILGVIGFLEKRHPTEPHYYLQFLGVEPEWQGRGLGSALLEPMLERCDREGMPAYLEASSERNRPLYERNGFEVVERVELPSGGPPMWRMWRDAQR